MAAKVRPSQGGTARRVRIPVLSAPTPLDAYVIHTKVRESIGHRAPVVGQREIFGGTYKPRHPSAGLTISQTPLDERVYGDDTRLFRVTDIRGLRRGSFRPPNWPTTGHCDSYLVAEELPLHVAFGPHGTQVLELVELAESLTVDDVVVTGEREGESYAAAGFTSDRYRVGAFESVTASNGAQST